MADRTLVRQAHPNMSEVEQDEPIENDPGFNWMPVWKALAAIPGRKGEVLAILNGAVGDRLAAEDSNLTIDFELLYEGQPLDLERDLAAQIPGATGQIVVLVHGLMANETIWTFPNGKNRSFGERLAEDVGVTPIYVRFNSGLHISANGRELSKRLDALVEGWPVPVEAVNLIGYSMGGLVSRSATHYGHETKAAWLELTERLFLVAVPSRGSPVEQLANIASVTLKTIPNPVTKIIAWVFRQRSAGIKDLRHGYLVDEEWQTRSPDALSAGRRHIVPLAADIDHYVLAGTLGDSEHHPLSKIIGDALVTPFSAQDEGIAGASLQRSAKEAKVFPGLNHLNIVSHDEVYSQILAWWRD